MIQGAESSSHLRLTVSGGDIIVQGTLAAQPAGCSSGSVEPPPDEEFRATASSAAVCPTGGVGSIEINMGPEGDKVEVLDPLPIALTVHLGNGSDKFIGNDEPDTCYSEGAKRNRCYGFGGNDVCITGPRNSDCVGGAGNDYCKHSTGSDGCWGGPGRDVCRMGAGADGCHGNGGNDRLYEGAGSGQLYGGPGVDYCNGGSGTGRSHTCEKGPGD